MSASLELFPPTSANGGDFAGGLDVSDVDTLFRPRGGAMLSSLAPVSRNAGRRVWRRKPGAFAGYQDRAEQFSVLCAADHASGRADRDYFALLALASSPTAAACARPWSKSDCRQCRNQIVVHQAMPFRCPTST